MFENFQSKISFSKSFLGFARHSSVSLMIVENICLYGCQLLSSEHPEKGDVFAASFGFDSWS